MSKFDWMTVPQVRKHVERLEDMLSSEDARIKRAGEMCQMTEGKTFILQVKITDGNMASLIQESLYGPEDKTGLPGFDVEMIGNAHHVKFAAIQIMKNMIDKLESG